MSARVGPCQSESLRVVPRLLSRLCGMTHLRILGRGGNDTAPGAAPTATLPPPLPFRPPPPQKKPSTRPTTLLMHVYVYDIA